MNKIAIYVLIFVSLIFFISCKKDKKRLPIITTSALQVGVVSAHCAAVLYEDGDADVTEKGICWGVNEDVSVSDNKVISSSAENAFSVEITGLEYSKTYFVRAYAINSFGISYGKVASFKTLSNYLPAMTLSMPNLPGATTGEVLLQLNQQSAATFTTGICWSTSSLPTVVNNSVFVVSRTHNDGFPYINDYPKIFQNLSSSTTYYVRAFSTSGVGFVYSNQISFTTTNPINILSLNSLGITDASISSEVSDLSVASISVVGICWSQNPMPSIADNKLEQAYSGAIFNSDLITLNSASTYYLRAYVTTTALVTMYSTEVKIRTYKGTVTDIDGNLYYTVQIGNQEWMAGNLKTSKFNNGATIQYVANYNQWVNSVNSQIPVYCYYADQNSNNTDYGKLYPRYVALASNIAPVGWHVATVAEWEAAFAGNSLNDLWKNGLNFGSNLTALSLNAGGRWDNGYSDLNTYGYFWAQPGAGTNNHIKVNANSSLVTYEFPGNGYSIRCVKD